MMPANNFDKRSSSCPRGWKGRKKLEQLGTFKIFGESAPKKNKNKQGENGQFVFAVVDVYRSKKARGKCGKRLPEKNYRFA